mmetsp:Transcript_25886/g.79942  ORF Transcript_25886/g.79942 Transcript_25886/m.79942 type:complete len:354 (-) Transcript_25886:47-1108(-)
MQALLACKGRLGTLEEGGGVGDDAAAGRLELGVGLAAADEGGAALDVALHHALHSVEAVALRLLGRLDLGDDLQLRLHHVVLRDHLLEARPQRLDGALGAGDVGGEVDDGLDAQGALGGVHLGPLVLHRVHGGVDVAVLRRRVAQLRLQRALLGGELRLLCLELREALRLLRQLALQRVHRVHVDVVRRQVRRRRRRHVVRLVVVRVVAELQRGRCACGAHRRDVLEVAAGRGVRRVRASVRRGGVLAADAAPARDEGADGVGVVAHDRAGAAAAVVPGSGSGGQRARAAAHVELELGAGPGAGGLVRVRRARGREKRVVEVEARHRHFRRWWLVLCSRSVQGCKAHCHSKVP